MKLIIQIPCYNEAETIAETLSDLPKTVDGFTSTVVLVVDDGSSDDTAKIALENGADYVIQHRKNRGLGPTFMTGMTTALALKADVIVNTDADRQYPGKYISELVVPIVSGEADLVIGDRQPGKNVHFSPIKRLLQVIGSWVIRRLSQTDAPDAPSGFRAYSRFAALRIQVHNKYSYTLETLIQAGREKMSIAYIPIQTNPEVRPSRLHKGLFNFIWRQSGVIIRSYILYQPLKSFFITGLPFLLVGGGLILRFLILYFSGESAIGRYAQSVSIGGTLLMVGVFMLSLGMLGDAIKANRKILEETLVCQRETSSIDTDGVLAINGAKLLKSRHLNEKETQ